MAVEQFAKLQKLDPYRLENMDTYSNLLYVKVCILLLFLTFCQVDMAVELFAKLQKLDPYQLENMDTLFPFVSRGLYFITLEFVEVV